MASALDNLRKPLRATLSFTSQQVTQGMLWCGRHYLRQHLKNPLRMAGIATAIEVTTAVLTYRTVHHISASSFISLGTAFVTFLGVRLSRKFLMQLPLRQYESAANGFDLQGSVNFFEPAQRIVRRILARPVLEETKRHDLYQETVTLWLAHSAAAGYHSVAAGGSPLVNDPRQEVDLALYDRAIERIFESCLEERVRLSEFNDADHFVWLHQLLIVALFKFHRKNPVEVPLQALGLSEDEAQKLSLFFQENDSEVLLHVLEDHFLRALSLKDMFSAIDRENLDLFRARFDSLLDVATQLVFKTICIRDIHTALFRALQETQEKQAAQLLAGS